MKEFINPKEKSYSNLWMLKKILEEELRHLRKKCYNLKKAQYQGKAEEHCQEFKFYWYCENTVKVKHE